MGDVVVQQFVSVDGFGADSDGDETTLFSTLEGSTAEFDRANAAWLERVGAIVLGGRTYRKFVTYWPTPASAGELVADRINALPKHVFSRTLTTAPWGEHDAAAVVTGDAGREVRRIAGATDGDVIVWGSFDLTGQLLRAGAVDALRVVVLPVVLGSGTPFVPADLDRRRLRLAEVARFDGDVVELAYRLG